MVQSMELRRFLLLGSLLVVLFLALISAQSQTAAFDFRQVMVPMRDGIHLQTVILTPRDKPGPLPILFRRTPYGVPSNGNVAVDGALKELVRDGYIFVVQNLRGRFQSEGRFELSSKVDLQDSKSTSETTDAYDSIDWLIKNVP